MAGELLAVIRSYRMQQSESLQRNQGLYCRFGKLFRILPVQFPHPEEPARPIVDCQHGSLLVLADYRVDFQVAEAFLLVDDLRTLLDTDPVRNSSAIAVLAASRAMFLALDSEMLVEVVPESHLFPNILVDAFRARGGFAQPSESAADLFGAVIQPDHVGDLVPRILAVFVVLVALVPTRYGKDFCCFRPVFPVYGVAPDFAAYRTTVDFHESRNLRLSPMVLQKRENKVSLVFV